MSRTSKSLKNIRFAVMGQLLGLIISFISRKVFVMILTQEYLGLNGLFTNILSILAISEMGVGTAIIYSMYKPIADNDTEKIKSLMQLYKKAYTIIGCFILIVGISITPFITSFISNVPDISESIYIIYIMYVVNTAASYFFIYKRSLIIANQNRYIATYYRYLMYFILNVCQIVALLATHNFYLYLGLQIANTIIENVLVSRKADKLYPYLKDKNVKPLEKADKKEITKNVGALMCHKIGGAVVNGTDNILLSRFIGVVVVGIYSNYYMISNALSTVYGLVFQSITASFGNLNVQADNERKVKVFNQMFFLGAWVACFCTSCLIALFNPFITLWLGNEYLFTLPLVIVISLNFFIKTMRQPALTAREAMGLFWYDRYKPIFEASINLGSSIVLCLWLRSFGEQYGVLGVFLGTAISSVSTNLWVEPYVLYKYGFKTKLRSYFYRYGYYTTLTVIASLGAFYLCKNISVTLGGFIIRLLICAVVPNAVFIIGNFKTQEFISSKILIKRIFSKVLRLNGKRSS